jgi:hypothetical protein
LTEAPCLLKPRRHAVASSCKLTEAGALETERWREMWEKRLDFATTPAEEGSNPPVVARPKRA